MEDERRVVALPAALRTLLRAFRLVRWLFAFQVVAGVVTALIGAVQLDGYRVATSLIGSGIGGLLFFLLSVGVDGGPADPRPGFQTGPKR